MTLAGDAKPIPDPAAARHGPVASISQAAALPMAAGLLAGAQ